MRQLPRWHLISLIKSYRHHRPTVVNNVTMVTNHHDLYENTALIQDYGISQFYFHRRFY